MSLTYFIFNLASLLPFIVATCFYWGFNVSCFVAVFPIQPNKVLTIFKTWRCIHCDELIPKYFSPIGLSSPRTPAVSVFMAIPILVTSSFVLSFSWLICKSIQILSIGLIPFVFLLPLFQHYVTPAISITDPFLSPTWPLLLLGPF